MVTLKYHGGKLKGKRYSDGINECNLDDPKSCIIVVDEASAVNKMRDHGDMFEVLKNDFSILDMLSKAKEEAQVMNIAVGGAPDVVEVEEVDGNVPEEDVEEADGNEEVDSEPVPDDTWSKTKIRKWLKLHNTTYENKDTVKDLLTLVEIVLEEEEKPDDIVEVEADYEEDTED